MLACGLWETQETQKVLIFWFLAGVHWCPGVKGRRAGTAGREDARDVLAPLPLTELSLFDPLLWSHLILVSVRGAAGFAGCRPRLPFWGRPFFFYLWSCMFTLQDCFCFIVEVLSSKRRNGLYYFFSFHSEPVSFLVGFFLLISEHPEVWKNYDTHREKQRKSHRFFFGRGPRQNIASPVGSDRRAPFRQVSLLNWMHGVSGLLGGLQGLMAVGPVEKLPACSIPGLAISLRIPVYTGPDSGKRIMSVAIPFHEHWPKARPSPPHFLILALCPAEAIGIFEWMWGCQGRQGLTLDTFFQISSFCLEEWSLYSVERAACWGAQGRLLWEGGSGVEPKGSEEASPTVPGERTFQAEGETNVEALKQDCALLPGTEQARGNLGADGREVGRWQAPQDGHLCRPLLRLWTFEVNRADRHDLTFILNGSFQLLHLA